MNDRMTTSRNKMKLWKLNFIKTNEDRMALKQNIPSKAKAASILKNG